MQLEVTPHDAIERVWREQGAKMYRSITAFTGDADLAADAVSEAFAQVLMRGEHVRDHARWIWRAAFKIAIGEMQSRRRRLRAESNTPAVASMPEPVADLVDALKTLSPNQRGVVLLHLYADLPAGEVADILGCSQATVRAHLARARRRLRPLLEDPDA